MRELQARQKFKHRLYSIPVLIVLAVITFLIIRGTYDVFQKKAESAQYVAALNQQVANLSNEDSSLTANMSSIGTPAGLEKVIKERFNVVAPGEHEAILVDPSPSASSTGSNSRPWYERLWDGILSAF